MVAVAPSRTISARAHDPLAAAQSDQQPDEGAAVPEAAAADAVAIALSVSEVERERRAGLVDDGRKPAAGDDVQVGFAAVADDQLMIAVVLRVDDHSAQRYRAGARDRHGPGSSDPLPVLMPTSRLAPPRLPGFRHHVSIHRVSGRSSPSRLSIDCWAAPGGGPVPLAGQGSAAAPGAATAAPVIAAIAVAATVAVAISASVVIFIVCPSPVS